MEVPEVLRLEEAALILKVSRNTMMRLIEREQIHAYRVGGELRVKAHEINRLLSEPVKPKGRGTKGTPGRPRVFDQ